MPVLIASSHALAAENSTMGYADAAKRERTDAQAARSGAQASAGFFGLRGWQDRGDMLRAVIGGIAFNHRHHVDALRDGFAPRAALFQAPRGGKRLEML